MLCQLSRFIPLVAAVVFFTTVTGIRLSAAAGGRHRMPRARTIALRALLAVSVFLFVLLIVLLVAARAASGACAT